MNIISTFGFKPLQNAPIADRLVVELASSASFAIDQTAVKTRFGNVHAQYCHAGRPSSGGVADRTKLIHSGSPLKRPTIPFGYRYKMWCERQSEPRALGPGVTTALDTV
jgi:hypothetical protein